MTITQIQIKRSQTTAIPTSLLEGEPAWSGNGGILYIGSNNNVVAIGGARTPGILTANQALVAAANGYLDVIKTANLYIGSISVNTINNSANATTLGSGSNNELTSTWAIKTYVQGQVQSANPGAAGSNTQVQINDSGSFAGDAAFTFDKDSGTLKVGNTTVYNTTNGAAIGFSGTDTITRPSSGLLAINGSLLVPSHLQFLDDNWEIHADSANGMIFNVYGGNDRGFRFRNSEAGYDLFSIDANSNTAYMNADSASLFVGNSVVNAVVSSSGLSLNGGQVVVNNSVVQVGANVKIDTSKSTWGNATVNSSSSATQHRVENATSVSTINADSWSVGNGTVNTQVTSTSLTTGQAIVNSSGFFFGSFKATSLAANVATLNVGVLAPQSAGFVNSAANLNFTGANVNIPNALVSVKNMSVSGDLNVSGNLSVTGTLTAVDATNLQVKDSMIKLADNNASDVLDLGFYALYNDGSNNRYTGLFRDATTGQYVLFANNLAEPTTTVDNANLSFTIATLQSYLVSGNLISNSSGLSIGANSTWSVGIAANSLSLSTALGVASGGTGLNTISDKDILVGNTTNGFSRLGFVAGSIMQSNATSVFWSNIIDCGTFLKDTLLLNTRYEDFEPILAKGKRNRWRYLDMAISGTHERDTI